MKKLLMTLVVFGLIAALAGGVLAAYSDSETSQGNTFTAGSLDLKVNGNDDPDVPALIEWGPECNLPGSKGATDIKVTNVGECDGIADIHIISIKDLENGCIEPEVTAGDDPASDVGELSPYLYIDLHYNGATIVPPTPIQDLVSKDIDLGPLAAGETAVITITYGISEDAPNNTMTDQVLVDIEFTLHQA